MSVKKIFIILITAVACVMIGALVLNVLMPNVFRLGINAVEQQIQRATGIALDLNGDNNNNNAINMDGANTGSAGTNVDGFTSGTGGTN